MKTILTRLFTVIMLMMFSMGVSAVDVELNKEYKGGKVKVKSQEDNPDGSTLVTITVTPDQGFTITHSDKTKGVIVVAVRPTGGQSGTRAPQIAGDLDVTGSTETVSYPNSVNYQFTVPAGLNAWVQDIKFQEKRGGSKFTTPDELGYTGTYYIASKSTRENNVNNYTYVPGTPAGNYYLCPTKGWYFYKSTDPFYQESDNGQPFLTTYKIRNSNDANADPTEAVWVLEKHPTETNCYYVRQRKITNNSKYRYMVSNGAINAGTRMRVHLEEVADDDALADLGDLALFEFIFNTSKNYWEIKPHSAEGKFDDNGTMRDYLVVNNGNYNQFTGHKDRTGGPNGTYKDYTAGIIGLYSQEQNGYWYLEEMVDRPTITLNNASGQIEISAAEGTTIRYTTNGDDPTATTGEQYEGPLSVFFPADATAIKAIAVRNSDQEVSNLAILPLFSYTYNIVDTEGHIAIKYTVKQPSGLALNNNYSSIPEAIRSPYLEDETMTFYSEFTEGSRDNLLPANVITNTPAGGGNIYVSYTTAHINDIDMPLHLNGSNPYKMQVNDEYVYDENKNLMHSSSDGGDADNYRWVLKGGDPYRVQIQNVKSSTHHFKWSTDPSASLTLGASSNFIIMGGNVARPDDVPTDFNDQVELMAANGADISSNAYYNVGRPNDSNVGLLVSGDYDHGHGAIQVLLKEVQKITTFHIIDKSGRIVIEQSGAYGSLAVPTEWRSPLVKDNGYHYYKRENFKVVNGVYTLLTGVEEIDNFITAPTDIYVTYDPKDENDEGFKDLDGSENRATNGRKYLLRFAGGTSFRQEKGDGFEATAAEGIYPYINGEGGLFVYGQAKLDETEGAVGSTRTRWAWYLEGGDPYRLRISTLQTRTDGNPDETLPRYSYLRTYMPKGYDKVVTGVISNNAIVYDGSDDAHAERHQPTEYMILNGTNGHFKLVTTDVVDDLDGNAANDVRHTVTSFENYWKTNPTALDALINKDLRDDHDPLQRPNPDLTDDERKSRRTSLGTQIDSDGLTQEQQAVFDGLGWHSYNVWAYGSTWTSSSKTFPASFHYGPHWFKTIDVGTLKDGVYNGDFDLVEYDLDGALILLDQHGWEVMRKPITNLSTKKEGYANAIRKYDSPMVKKYHFWTNFKKEDGYHKYKPVRGVSSSKDAQHKGVGTSLTDYPEVLSTGTLADIYVTYEVMATYRDGYTCAEAENGPQFSQYLVRQGENYAKTNVDGVSITLEPEPVANVTDVSAAGPDLLWYLKPNVNIDSEMGYHYSGDGVAKYGEKTKAQTESDYYTNRDATVHDTTNGQNGFDPYNLQIESVAHSGKLFTTNATGAGLDGSGGLVSTYAGAKTLGLEYTPVFNVTNYYDSGSGYQILHVTNSTFMAVSDANGNIRLMPRFDHHNVVELLATLETQLDARPYGDESGDQTTLFVLPSTSSTPSGDPITISSSDEITDMNGYYLLSNDFGVTKVVGTEANPFRGTIDGQLNTIDGLSRPLVAYANGATIKNVIVKMASINAGNAAGNAGAICCQATGNTRIYNCGILPNTIERDEDGNITGFSGSHVTGSENVGGIVGQISGNTRVINCFSYATITGGTTVAGIVGNNMGTTTAASITTMVMNCMFYGDITGGTTVSPVYGGNNIANLQGGLNTFNYYSYENLKTKAITDDKYNSALAVEEKYLNRFEFYRLLLNSNKKLATFYVTGNAADDNLMAKWVLETADRQITNPMPYPVLKAQGRYPSIINIDADHADQLTLVDGKPKEEDRNKGGKIGTLSVTIKAPKDWTNAPTGAKLLDENGDEIDNNESTRSITLPRTDKEFDRFNFNYDKVQLPYYNDYGTKNYTSNKVVTGWKITAITSISGDPYTSANYPTSGITDYPNHNYADRKSSNKDLYSVSNRVFSQGAYFDVPYGVSSITIEPYWGNAIYVADPNYDVVYKNDYTGKQNVTQTGTQAVDNTTLFNGQKIRTSITGLGSGTTVYDNAVVLVGNFHLGGVPSNGTTPFTMMSVDEDNDHEPDYSLIYHHIKRLNICPIRFDFLDVIGTAQAQKPNDASLICNFTICKTKGWFEVTNTALIYSSQFEYENLGTGDNNNNTGKLDGPLILLGGVFDQFVSTQSSVVNGKVYYIHVGGNVWINSFGLGTHSDGSESTPHVPVSVTGGEFPGFYLTGTYNQDAAERSDNAECYISGGYFHEAAGASQEAINGNVRWQIYDADIENFFGGGTNDAHFIKGDVTVDIYNSHVTTYCGGPKFGNMQGDKKVTTHAEGCVFGTYFGAGFGGLSYSRKKYYDKDDDPVDWSSKQNYYTGNTGDRGKYYNGSSTGLGGGNPPQYGYKGPGVATDFDYEYFVWSSGKTGGRFFVKFASFSLAQCRDVESKLKNCTIENNFYGGGSLGKVVGTVDSELDGCTVKGNVFGAGFSATLPTLEVRDGGFTKVPNFNKASGMFEPGEFSGTTTFNWETGTFPNNGNTDPKFSSGKVTTNINLEKSNLGSVDGNVNLTLKGNTTVGTLEGRTGSQTLKDGTGNVFGGGESSYVTGASHKVTVILQDNTEVLGNVFGGGDEGLVEGSTEVNIRPETPPVTPPVTPDPEP